MKDEQTEESRKLIEERCECGNLLCKISPETVEIKCRRCKRIHIIPIKRLLEIYQKHLSEK